MRVYKSVWHADLWAANNCKQEDINSFFEKFNNLAKELLEVEGEHTPSLATEKKFLALTQVDGVPLLRLRYLDLSERLGFSLYTSCGVREGIYSNILNAMPLVITPQNIDYIFFPDTSSQ